MAIWRNLMQLIQIYVRRTHTHTYSSTLQEKEQTHFWQWQAILSPEKIPTGPWSLRISTPNKYPSAFRINLFWGQQNPIKQISIPTTSHFHPCWSLFLNMLSTKIRLTSIIFHLYWFFPWKKNSTKSIKNHHVIYQIWRKPPFFLRDQDSSVPRAYNVPGRYVPRKRFGSNDFLDWIGWFSL